MRPSPQPTQLSRPFWDACRDERLVVQRCSSCQQCFFIPSAFCPACLSTAYEWIESAGLGRIVTFTVVWRPPTPAFDPPYVVAIVHLDEGYDMFSNVVGTAPDQVTIGDRVRVRFSAASADVTLPFFEIITEA